MASPKNLDTKSLILSTCEDLIERDGVNTITLKDIASAAHLSQGTLYYYYKTKDDLVFDLLERHMNGLKKDFEQWLLRHRHDGLSGKRFLEVVVQKAIKLFNKSKVHLYLIYECLSDARIKARYLELLEDWEKALEEGIRLSFPSLKDPRSFASLLMTTLDGLMIKETLDKENNKTEGVLNYLHQIGEAA